MQSLLKTSQDTCDSDYGPDPIPPPFHFNQRQMIKLSNYCGGRLPIASCAGGAPVAAGVPSGGPGAVAATSARLVEFDLSTGAAAVAGGFSET